MNIIKFFFIAFLPLCAVQTGYAQEKSIYKCAYRLEFLKDTLSMTYFRPETYIVQIGKNITKGFTYQKFYLDSLKSANLRLYNELFNASVNESIENMKKTGDVSFVRNSAFHHGSFTSELYKDYKKNEIRVKDNISIYPFVFTDELLPQNWEILVDTATILGYASQKQPAAIGEETGLHGLHRKYPSAKVPGSFTVYPVSSLKYTTKKIISPLNWQAFRR